MEKELLSSTSDEVCELWNGKSIVRTKGHLLGHDMTTLLWRISQGVMDAEIHYKLLEDTVDETQPSIRHMLDTTPSLTLNLREAKFLRREAWLLALVGVALQIAVLAVAGTIVYLGDVVLSISPGDERRQQAVAYGFICYLVGTITLFIGVLGCGYSIDAATVKHTLRRVIDITEEDLQINTETVPVRLQLACTVGDQHFRPFAIFNPPGNQDIRFSTWKPDGKNHE